MKNAHQKELDQLRQLNNEIGVVEDQIARAESRGAELQANREALAGRLSDAQARRPAQDVDLDDPLALALANDPAAQLAADEVARAAESSSKRQGEMRAWRKENSLIERAIAIVDRDADAAKERLEQLQGEHKTAREAFFRAAHPCLMAMFKERFAALHREVLGPLLGVEQMEDQNRNALISRGQPRLSEQTEIVITAGYGSNARDEYLLPGRTNLYAKAPNCREDAERFRLELGAPGQP